MHEISTVDVSADGTASTCTTETVQPTVDASTSPKPGATTTKARASGHTMRPASTRLSDGARNRKQSDDSLRLDMLFGKLGLGRLQLVTGTSSAAEFVKIKALLKQLAAVGEVDILRALCDRRIALAALLDAHRSKTLPALRTLVIAETSKLQPIQVPGLAVQAVVSAPPRTAPSHNTTPLDLDEDFEVSDATILQTSFWHLLTSNDTWADSKAQPVTLARYQQAIRAFRIRLALIRLPREELEALACLPTRIWTALEHAQRRGISVSELQAFVDSGEIPRKHKQKKRRQPSRSYSMENRTPTARAVSTALTQARLGRVTILSLRLLLADQWRILKECDERIPTRGMVLGVLQLSGGPRDNLIELARVLGPTALTRGLNATKAIHWNALWAAWNRSPADWNHLRRAVSAALTCAFGHSEHTTRLKLMRRFPLKVETPRVADVDYETFERIVEHIPVPYRPAFRTLLHTGVRLAEFVRLEPKHLRARSRIIEVPGTKNGQSASFIKCDADFWPDLLLAVPCPISASGLYQIWRKARAAADANWARQHDLRHAFGQWSLATGVNDSEVQQALRQKSSNVTADYRRMVQSEAASAGLAKAIRDKRAERDALRAEQQQHDADETQ